MTDFLKTKEMAEKLKSVDVGTVLVRCADGLVYYVLERTNIHFTYAGFLSQDTVGISSSLGEISIHSFVSVKTITAHATNPSQIRQLTVALAELLSEKYVIDPHE